MNEKRSKSVKKELRYGYTTGACATATTKAALIALITGEKQISSTILLPVGKFAQFEIENCIIERDFAEAATRKNGGDDPDATHGAIIKATVSWSEKPGITIDGGVGVGRVTKEGLPVAVGEAAINPVPRQMILSVAEEVLQSFDIHKGISIIISVPEGEKIAEKTLNKRLGIIGGISILGTRGIVVPFSNSAYMASIVQALRVARASGCEHVVVTTGGRSEKYGMLEYPHLPEEAFIEMGDFISFTLKQCKKLKFQKVSLIGMMGKFSKFAQGIGMVHARSSSVDFNFLATIAEESNINDPVFLEKIRNANTASQVGDWIFECGDYEFYKTICLYCCKNGLKEAGGGIAIETSLYSLNGVLLGKAGMNG